MPGRLGPYTKQKPIDPRQAPQHPDPNKPKTLEVLIRGHKRFFEYESDRGKNDRDAARFETIFFKFDGTTAKMDNTGLIKGKVEKIHERIRPTYHKEERFREHDLQTPERKPGSNERIEVQDGLRLRFRPF